MLLDPLLLEIGNHQGEVAETLIAVGQYLVIFLAARALADAMPPEARRTAEGVRLHAEALERAVNHPSVRGGPLTVGHLARAVNEMARERLARGETA